MREYTPEYIQDMREKLRTTKRNAGFFLGLGQELNEEEYLVNRHNKRADRMVQCLDLFAWDMYSENKLLDLQRVNRCKDRFCPNCRSIAISQAITKFELPFKDMLKQGYNPYLMTLTIKNVHGSDLVETISRMQKAFRNMFQWLSQPVGKGYKGFKNRIFEVKAGIKALEITIQKGNGDYFHPHFHIMLFLDNENPNDFKKHINDGYRRKSKNTNLLSDADVFISKLWTFAYDKIRINKWDLMTNEVEYEALQDGTFKRNYYMCDIRELEMPGGIYEVFKYCFKDSDIKTFEQFKYIYNATNGKRLRQGHGLLFNADFECEGDEMSIDDSDKIEMYLEKEETPQQLITRKLEELTTTYKTFKKISRFKGSQHINFIK